MKNNAIDNYKVSIPEDKILKLNQHFEKKEKNGKGYLISKIILSSSLRKFISRFLSGKRNELEINPDFELFNYMEYREDIWESQINQSSFFDEEISELKSS